jgi:hypothetical protein
LSYDERDKIRKDRDKKGEQGGTKRLISSISEMTPKQLTTALLSSLQKATPQDNQETTKTNTSAGNSFGGRESAKRAKTD